MGLLDDRQRGLLAMQHNIDPRYKAASRAAAAQVLRGLLAPQQMAEMALAFAPGSGDAMAVRDGQRNFADMRKSIEGGDYGKAASDAIYGTTAYVSALPVLGAAIPHFGGMLAGKGAKTADLVALRKAEDLEKAGGDASGRVFYRGTTPGDTRQIAEPFSEAKGMTFVAQKPESARMYGEHIEQFVASPDAKILRDESPEFWKLVKRRRPPNGYVGSARGGAVEVVNDAVRAAKSAGYDAVSFSSDADIGTVILNEGAFSRKASDPARRRGLLDYGQQMSLPDAPGLPMGEASRMARADKFKANDLPSILDDLGYKYKVENSQFMSDRHGPSPSSYYTVETPQGTKRFRVSDHEDAAINPDQTYLFLGRDVNEQKKAAFDALGVAAPEDVTDGVLATQAKRAELARARDAAETNRKMDAKSQIDDALNAFGAGHLTGRAKRQAIAALNMRSERRKKDTIAEILARNPPN